MADAKKAPKREYKDDNNNTIFKYMKRKRLESTPNGESLPTENPEPMEIIVSASDTDTVNSMLDPPVNNCMVPVPNVNESKSQPVNEESKSHLEKPMVVNSAGKVNGEDSLTQMNEHSGVACTSQDPDDPITKSDSCVKTTTKYKHTFKAIWTEKWPWLSEDEGVMLCQLCIKHNKKNTLSLGCKNYRTSTLERHATSHDHQEALKQDVMSKNFSQAASTAVKKSAAEPGLTAAMRTVYWMAKEDLPIKKYPSLVSFLKLQGCDYLKLINIGQNATYSSRQSGEEFQECISDVIHEGIIKTIRESEMFSVLTDKSTDIAICKQMVLYCRIVDKSFIPHTYFLKNITIANPKSGAEVLFNAILEYLRKEGLNTDRLLAFGSDGASVMVGKHSGVATRLKQISPHLTSIHCMAHRFNLCTSQASRGISYLKDFEKTLNDLYYYFGGSKSGNRKCELEDIQKVLDDPLIKIKECHEIRWIAFYEAIHAVYKCWRSLVTYFTKHDNKISQKLSDYRFVYSLYFMMDILPSVAQISMVLQKRNIDIAAILPALNGLKEKIKIAQKGDAYYQKELRTNLIITDKEEIETQQNEQSGELKEKERSKKSGSKETKKSSTKKSTATLSGKSQMADLKKSQGPESEKPPSTETQSEVKEAEKSVTFKGQNLIYKSSFGKEMKTIRAEFCQNLSSNIESRFPKESTDVATAFHVLCMRPISFMTKEERDKFGEKEMDILINHYGQDAVRGDVKSPALIDGVKCREEWAFAKRVVLEQHYPRDNTNNLLKMLHDNHKESLPNIMKLANLALIMPYQTADCERGFSCQNTIKTNKRNRLKEDHLNDLMTIKLEGGNIDEFDFESGILKWKNKKNRRINQKH